MGRIKSSAELANADTDSYWPAYIHELEEVRRPLLTN
jgi:hypothetical protein